MERTLLADLAEKWPSSFVSRGEIKNFTGGIISDRYIANFDSSGLGPAGRIRCGRKIVYPVKELIRWLEARSEVIPERGERGAKNE